MGVIFSDKYPYTDFHELNLDWLLAQMVKLDKAFETFTSANTLTSADPIDWNISTQYGKNTIVVDPESGIAYLSVQPVPAGIEITNTDYWTPVFEFETLLQEYKDQMLAAYNEYKDELLDALDNFIYYAPNYGIVPNTGADMYETIFRFLKDVVWPNGGGIVYFPPGEYITSYTIFVPANTMFVGAGPETVIYFNERDTYMGVALSNGGSNVGIINMTVNSVNTGTIDTTHSLPGSIGISNINDADVTEPYSHEITRADTENIYVHNIYADSNYVLQVEPTAGHVIKNVTIDGIYAPESMVSLYGNDAVENVTYRNIVCDVFRLGTEGNAENVVADTVRCRTAFFRNFPKSGENYGNMGAMHVSNLDLNTTGYHSDMTVPVRCGGPVDFVNCSFDNAAGLGTALFNRYYGILTFTNCRFNNFANLFAAGVDATTNDYCYNVLTNCILNQTDQSVVSYLIGRVSNCVLTGRFRIADPMNINRNYVGTQAALITSTHTIAAQTINIANGNIFLDITITLTDTSSRDLFTIVNPYLRAGGMVVIAEAWNSSSPATRVRYSATFLESGLVRYDSAHSAYNTARIIIMYPANHNASIGDIFALSDTKTYSEMRV